MNQHPTQDLLPEDFQNALKDLDTYIDITIDDLMQINQIATRHAKMRQAEQLLVQDLMTTNVTVVTPTTSVKDAARILLEQRISGLPVVDEGQKLVGIVTEADFLTALGIPCHHPAHNLWQSLESMFKHQQREVNKPNYVTEIMVSEVITVNKEQTLQKVIYTMRQHHVKRLVVTNEQQHVEGIITRSNLVRVLLKSML